MVEPREISQTEATISNNEYTATIAFAATTNRKAPKSYQRGEPGLVASMNTAAERAKQKAARRKKKINVLKRRSLRSERVEWKCGVSCGCVWWIRGRGEGLSTPAFRVILLCPLLPRSIGMKGVNHERWWNDFYILLEMWVVAELKLFTGKRMISMGNIKIV